MPIISHPPSLQKIAFLVLGWLLWSPNPSNLVSQPAAPIVTDLTLIDTLPPGRHHLWLEMGSTTFSLPELVPVILIRGAAPGPTLGLTAAIHGNELNGIPVIQGLTDSVDYQLLRGNLLGVPGLNVVSVQADERRFFDGEDLNRRFPGKADGDQSQQYVHAINTRLLPALDVLIDLHTASFGRTNALYARADLDNDTLMALAVAHQPDIILASKGAPSAGNGGSGRTLRAEATLRGIPCLTVELGNPQVYQSEMAERGIRGGLAALNWLNMYGKKQALPPAEGTYFCQKSAWLYTDRGGFLEVLVELNDRVAAGQLIARQRDAFGTVIREYFAPGEGVIIGKSTNPAGRNGSRIVHLGVP